MKVYLTVGEDGKAAVSDRLPIMHRVAGTERTGLYPPPGSMVWVPGQCLEAVAWLLEEVPPVNEPVALTLSLRRRK